MFSFRTKIFKQFISVLYIIIRTLITCVLLYRYYKTIKIQGRDVLHHLLRLLRPRLPNPIKLRTRGHQTLRHYQTLASVNRRSCIF
ncbi:hypothetical protein Hanom_Chr01g00081621 [Helianthus anomalus]